MKPTHTPALVREHPRHVIIGTAGHIDHGKTALVYALTGTDTDRLPEEKQRGITIDLGFAALELHHPQYGKLHISLIDVPGHHAFIRNMLAGAGGIDCVMLVIAADEGVKPQTEEHLAICSLLGIERGLVVLTKIDAVSESHLAETHAAVQQFLRHTFLDGALIIAVSAIRGTGMAELKSSLANLAAQIPARSSERLPRLPLDRAFTLRGFGTVVTGTLHSGSLRAGSTLQQQPQGRLVRVRTLQVHGKSVETAHAPCRAALNLAGVELTQIARGDTLIDPHTLTPSHTIDVELTMLRGAPALKHGARLQVHAFTSDTLAKLLLFDQKRTTEPNLQSPPGCRPALARLQLAYPLLLIPGDKIVLRLPSPAATIGGARVLDTSPSPGLRKAKTLEWLTALQSADDREQLRMRVARRGVEGISLDALIAQTGLTKEALRTRLANLATSNRVIPCGASGTHWITAESLAEAVNSSDRQLTAAGTLSRAELQSKTALNSEVFTTVLQRLAASGKFELAAESIRVAGRLDDLPEPKRRHMQSIEDLYAKAGLAAPLLSEVAAQTGESLTAMRELITLLLRSKRLVRMGADDAFVHTDALAALYANLRRHRGEFFDVSRFKQFTGLTRKHAIPLLEHLDQARVTRNNNGTRIVL